MDVKEIFAERLKKLRGSMSQDTLGKALDISRGSVSFYEQGSGPKSRTIDIEVLSRVKNYFGVNYDYLLGETPYKTQAEKDEAETSKTELIAAMENSDLQNAKQIVEQITAIMLMCSNNGIEVLILPMLLEVLSKVGVILDSYQSHTLESYLLDTAIGATTPTSNQTKLISTSVTSYLKEFTYDAFTPTKEIQDNVQAMVALLQGQLLSTLSEGGKDNGEHHTA